MSAGKWYFFDMETLGQSEDAVILSIGISCVTHEMKNYTFDQRMRLGYYSKLNKNQQLPERTVDNSTMDWWKSQGDSAKSVLSSEHCVDVYTVYKQVIEYFNKTQFDVEQDIIWSRGLIDQRWWASLCNKTFSKFGPVQDILPFWRWRDTRTACDLLVGNPNGHVPSTPEHFIKHNALCDAVMDSIRLHEAAKLYEN